MLVTILRGLQTPRRRRWQMIFAILLLNNCFVLPQQRSGFMLVARKDYRLKGHLIYEKDVASDLECAHLCLAHSKRCPPCKSVNLQKKQGSMSKRKCQLNNETDENVKPESLVPDVAFNIWKWEKLQYSAGSSHEQCEREDETCLSNPCHSNATCTDYQDFYNCTCKLGFFGNGKNCTDLGAMKTSKILAGNLTYFGHLHQWLNGTKHNWHLCWRATQHGWEAKKFHDGCDYKVPTVTIVQVGQYVFGGFADKSWEGDDVKASWNSFLFSLRNKDNVPAFKAVVYKSSNNAIHANPGWGPAFGSGHGLHISNNANSSSSSYTYFGDTYKPPSGYTPVTAECHALLAGTYAFTPNEVEVYYLP